MCILMIWLYNATLFSFLREYVYVQIQYTYFFHTVSCSMNNRSPGNLMCWNIQNKIIHGINTQTSFSKQKFIPVQMTDNSFMA